MPLFGLNIFSDNPDSKEHNRGRQGNGYRDSVAQLPCLPQVVLALINAHADKKESVANLSRIVRLDPVLCLNMLAADPSEYPERFSTLDEVMERIGPEGVISLARTIAFRSHFSSQLDSYRTLPAFVQQSLLRAMLARELAVSCQYKAPDEAYLAGMFCDVGRLAIGSLNIQQDGAELLAEEKELYQTDHIEAGVELLRFLEQSSFIVDAVRYHHEDSRALDGAHELIRIVHAANALYSDLVNETEQRVSQVASLLSLAGEQVSRAMQVVRTSLPAEQQWAGIRIKEEDTASARHQLSLKVQQYGMLYAYLSQLLHIHDEEEQLATILKISQTLFKPERQLLFVLDEESGKLVGMNPANMYNSLVEEIKIPVNGASFIVKTLDSKDPVSIVCNELDSNGSVLDKQILGLLNTDVIVYLPLVSMERSSGILLLGFNSDRPANQGNNYDLFKLFADDVARIIDSFRHRQQPARQSPAPVTSPHDARWLVHEVSTPLSVIKNYLAMLSMKVADTDSASDDTRIISDEIERIHSIIRKFADGETKGGQRKVDVNTVIHDVVKVLNEGFVDNQQFTISLDLDSNTEAVTTNPDSLKQILINLIKNAAEAMQNSNGGGVIVRTRGNVRFEDSNYVELAVVDNGPGIPPAIFKNLFHKVESTKSGEHSGLGLNIVYSLVKEMNGKISCRTMDRKGTVFHILLPKDTER